MTNDPSDADRLTRLEVMLEQQQSFLAAIRGSVERVAMQQTAIQHRLTQQETQLVQVQQTVTAIKDMLERGNGRP